MQIIIDATELDEGYQKKKDYYLTRCYNRGEPDDENKRRYVDAEREEI